MNIKLDKLRVGDKVHYQPDHYPDEKWDNGMVKEIPEYPGNAVRVVYKCDNDWDRFKHYTSELTRIDDLKLGWRD